MLYLNVSDQTWKQWGRTIDLYYAVHLGGFLDEIKSVNLMIEELLQDASQAVSSEAKLYRCELEIIPKNGEIIQVISEREDCGAGVEYSFAKAKRQMLRRLRVSQTPCRLGKLVKATCLKLNG